MKMTKNEDIQDRLNLISQLQEAEAWLAEWAAAPGLSDSDIEGRIALEGLVNGYINKLQKAEFE
jgi:hypothetical protein